MKTQHTPGPHFVKPLAYPERHHTSIDFEICRFDNKYPIAFLSKGNGVPDEEVEANAKLFVAAPDMLEALQAAYIGLSVDSSAYEIVKAAIAKAKGVQS